jgi:hypothetical protein
MCVRTTLSPFGSCPLPTSNPRLTPFWLRQGGLWAAFSRRFAAKSLGALPADRLREFLRMRRLHQLLVAGRVGEVIELM